MTSPNTATAMTADNMDELLSDLELEMSSETVEEESVIDDIEDFVVENDGDLAAVEALTEKEEAVASQTSEIEADSSAVEQKTSKAAKAPKTPKEPKQPKIERDLSALDDSVFQLVKDGPIDKAAVIALRPAQKKVAEKFDNLFTSLAACRKPSVYTMACFNVLVDKGEVTSSDLVAAMKAAASRSGGAYSDGTARSQVGQLMNLFGAVGIATRAGNKLTFNKDSQIAASLQVL
jgi:hypothetical protein